MSRMNMITVFGLMEFENIHASFLFNFECRWSIVHLWRFRVGFYRGFSPLYGRRTIQPSEALKKVAITIQIDLHPLHES